MALTYAQVKNAAPREKDYRLSDGGNLYLLVKAGGQKHWRMKYRVGGKERMLAIGPFPEISLKQARAKRDDARSLLRQGVDPVQHFQEQRAQQQATSEPSAAEHSFRDVGTEWFETVMVDKSDSHRSRTWRALERDLFPYIGDCDVNAITPFELLQVLRRIEARGHYELANRTRRVASQIFRFAVVTGRAERDPSSDLSGALKTPKVRHMAAITEPEAVGKLLVAIDSYQGTAVVEAALKLSPLLFCRPGELRHLQWSDFRWSERRIEIPGERMKMGEPHVIPLSDQAETIFRNLQRLTGGGVYVFPSLRGEGRPMSENAVRTALRSLGYANEEVTPHGFRAMARTLLDEALEYRIELIEQQLAHTVRDALGRAYNRTKHFSRRAEMMQAWADYLDSLKNTATSL